ncbi:MAG: toll/interleukin-1 receptor domain-containing protein [Chthoniobacter sp.]|uniref:toll/interleukin-1 receptor domain-containing protein n=1 Tax=Chthoniobacter sp. TaxID=2510640 RepID=UPI0032AB6360
MVTAELKSSLEKFVLPEKLSPAFHAMPESLPDFDKTGVKPIKTMAESQHLEILESGVEAWNEWRNDNPQVVPDLRGADLSDGEYTTYDPDAGLIGINLEGADLRNAKLRDADLFEANMRYANLEGADLCGAGMSMADLIRTNCQGAHLQMTDLTNSLLFQAKLVESDLWRTNFSCAWLTETDFSKSRIEGTIFDEVDLSEARGLETVRHSGPSVIGISTIYASKGRISEVFLRGCGVPESLIDYLPSLVGAQEGIRFYSCFISYSSEDEEFAKRLHSKMRDAHLRVWFAPEDIQGGKKLHEQIETAIRIHDKLLIVLSEASLQSEWVMTELRKAFKAERREGKRKLFPVRLVDMETIKAWECFDADSGKDLATELREYFIPDFSHWKDHDKFEESFTRLLKDLKANA